MEADVMVRRRKRYSRLNQPAVVAWLRRCAMSRITGAGTQSYTLDFLVEELRKRFLIDAHRTTVFRFLRRIGLDFAWARGKK
ncbi:hypothetical protein [Paraburkholderia mimosarum]|uniref:hypothetical protein n=1 Tax=Paraburkholderia mimosarum TaxID=312026 RepID=UPI0004897582|nr:hypothetical protein [Paraburkholderia mimosarum]